MKDIETRVFEHIRKLKKTERIRQIRRDHLLVEDLGLDSMNLVLLFTGVSGELGLDLLDFSDADLSDIRTAGQLAALFEKQYTIKL
jgi:acyl carrier protein